MKRLLAALLVSLGLVAGSVATGHAQTAGQTFTLTYHNPLGLTDPNYYATQIQWFYPSGTVTARAIDCYPSVYTACTDGKSYTVHSLYRGVPETVCWGTYNKAVFEPMFCEDASAPGTYSFDALYL